MFSVDLSTHVIVVRGGDLDIVDAVGAAAALTLTRLIDVFPVYASVDEAARTAGLTWQAAAPVDGSPARVA